jgi:hypothetical protein
MPQLHHRNEDGAPNISPPTIDRAKSAKQEVQHQPESAYYQSVHELEILVFRYTAPILRGQSSWEEMLDSGNFVMPDKNIDDGDGMLVKKQNDSSEGSVVVAAQPKQTNSIAEADTIKTAYHDTTNEMHTFQTSLLHWDDMVVTTRGHSKKQTLFDNDELQQQAERNNENRQEQIQKQTKQLVQQQDEYEIGNQRGDHSVISNLLVQLSHGAPRSLPREEPRQGTEQSNSKLPVNNDASNSTSHLRQKQKNSTLYFEEVLLHTTTKEQNATDNMIVLPEGPMLRGRGGRNNINSEQQLEDSFMYFGTLVSEKYESHGTGTLYVMAVPGRGVSTSCCIPVVAPMLMLLVLLLAVVVAIWSKARPPPNQRSHQ